MTDGINPSEIRTTNEIPTTTSDKKTLDVKEMGAIAKTTEASFKSVPEFSERMVTEQEIAKKIVAGIKSGEIDEETAVKIIAVDRTGLAMASETDPLTELPNRKTIEKIVREQVTLATRHGAPISIAFVDLDKFKDINDRYGHDAGDAVLQAIGGYLKSELKRQTDKAGRWGGDEFIIVLPDTNEQGASQLLNNLRQEMSKAVSEAVLQIAGYKLDKEITASIGFASSFIDKNDPRPPEVIVNELIKLADKRLILAKENGRNQVVGTLQKKELVHQT